MKSLNVSPAPSVNLNEWSNIGATHTSAKFKSDIAFLKIGFSRMEISSMLCCATTTPRIFPQPGGIHKNARANPLVNFSFFVVTDHCHSADRADNAKLNNKTSAKNGEIR